MSTTRHSEVVADLLRASAYAGDVNQCPPKEASEDRMVAVWPGGDLRDPQHFVGGDEAEHYRLMHLRSRGRPNDYKEAESDMRAIRDALKHATPPDYVSVRLQRGGDYIGPDDDDRHEFSYRVLCWIVE